MTVNLELFMTAATLWCMAEMGWTKIQYLENGPNYIRVCCNYVAVEAFEINFDEKMNNVQWLPILNSTSISNVTLDKFLFSNMHKGYVIPLLPRYGFQLYKWYVLCLDTDTTRDCIFVRPCDCNCNNKAWLKLNVTMESLQFPSIELNVTLTPTFDTTTYPLPVLPSFNWFAADSDMIAKCKTGAISPENCDFPVSGDTQVHTYKSSTTNLTMQLRLNTEKVYFSVSVLIAPRWTDRFLTVEEQSLEPLSIEINRNQTISLAKQFIINQVSEDKLSGRSSTASVDKMRQCTDIGSIAMADALKHNDNNRSDERRRISVIAIFTCVIFTLLYIV